MPEDTAPTVEEVRYFALFEGLSDPQLRGLLADGEVVWYTPGRILYEGSSPADHWWVNLEGTADLVAVVGGQEVVFARFTDPGQWAGGHRAWDDQAVYLGQMRATSAGRVLKIRASVLRSLLERLPLISHLTNGLFHSVRAGEAQLRQRAAVVTLGALSAGLAHEINNPASAASSAAGALGQSMAEVRAAVQRMVGGAVSPPQFAALTALRDEIGPRTTADPLTVSDREGELSDWLASRTVARDWVIGPALAAHDVDVAWCERLAGALDGPALQAGLEWVASTLTVDALIADVQESTSRVSAYVAAMKSYSQMDRATLQRIDVTEGIDSTLVVLGHQLQNVTILRDYGADVQQIDAFAGELNQVWTNLVDNAVDAMDGHGTLTVTTRPSGDCVLVEIADTGVGMPPEVAARAFDAFFTTKQAGNGIGFGLDIARRVVVDKHGGTIAIDSQPGHTVIRVRLPAHPPT